MINLKKNILKMYSISSTIIENILYKKNNSTTLFNEIGFLKFKIKHQLFKEFKFKTTLNRNKYFKILLLEENDINKILKKLFLENKLCEKITSLTGFNYRINYLIFYETFNIPEELKNEEIYANQWHFDKPFSKNTLKIIIPLQKIDINSGPMKILNIDNSKKLDSKNFINPDLEVIGDENDIFIFNPNLCAHKAGVPDENKTRKQLMIQLNPAKNWSYSRNLNQKQLRIEPKFPLFNIFEKYYQF